LFAGRYKSLLVEPGAPLGQLCHYIHLNPVRAGGRWAVENSKSHSCRSTISPPPHAHLRSSERGR
jgi:hypothetical protein